MDSANSSGPTNQKQGHHRRNICNRDLWLAATSGTIHDIDMAIASVKKSNGSVDAKNMFGSTALHIATWRNHVPIVRRLLAAGADADVRDEESGWSSLHRALHFGHLAVAGVLIEAGASLMIEDAKGRTAVDLVSGPLQQAISNSKEGGTTEVFSWGNGSNYQLGTGKAGIQRIPCRIDAFQDLDVQLVAAAKFHSAAVTKKGELYSWGFGRGGRLGHLDFDIHSGQVAVITPRQVICGLGTRCIKAIALAKHHSIVSTDAGEVYTWGSNREGQLGYPSVDTQPIPRRVNALKSRVVAVAAANKHSVVVADNGDVYSWGCNKEGQLGYGTSNSASNYAPRSVEYLKSRKLAAVSAAKYHTVVLGVEGEVFTWGYKMVIPRRVSISRNTRKGGPLPLKFHSVEKLHIVAIAAGMTHTTALSEDGSIFFWNSADPSLRCCQLLSMAGHQAVAVAAGKYRTAVTTGQGIVYVWDGEKRAGDEVPIPVCVHGIRHVTHVAVGEMHSLAIASLYVPSFPPRAENEPCTSPNRRLPDQDKEGEESLESDDSSGLEVAAAYPSNSEVSSKVTSSLKELCQKVVAHCIVEPKNALQLLEVADSLGADNLKRYCEDMILHNLDYVLTISPNTFANARPSLLADLEKTWDVSSAQPWSHRHLPMPSATLPAVIDSEDDSEVSVSLRARCATISEGSNTVYSRQMSNEGIFQHGQSGDDALTKQIRAVRKKLQQIEALELKQAKGHSLDDQQLLKLQSKAQHLQSLASLESGILPEERRQKTDNLGQEFKNVSEAQKGRNVRRKQNRCLSKKESKTLADLEQGLDVLDKDMDLIARASSKPKMSGNLPTNGSFYQDNQKMITLEEAKSPMLHEEGSVKSSNTKLLPSLDFPPGEAQPSKALNSSMGFVIESLTIPKTVPVGQARSHSAKIKGKTGGLSLFLSGALDARPHPLHQPSVPVKREGPPWGGVHVQKGPASLRDIQTQQIFEAGRQQIVNTKHVPKDMISVPHGEMEPSEKAQAHVSLESLIRTSDPIAVTPAKGSGLNLENSTLCPWAGISPGTSAPSLRDIQNQQVKTRAQQPVQSSFGSPHGLLTLSAGCSSLTSELVSSADSSNRWFKPETGSTSSIRCIQIEEKAMKELRRFYKDVKMVKNME